MDSHNKDHVLASLVEIVNVGAMSFSVTLTASGLTVSGNLISQSKWFDRQAEKIKAAPNAEATQMHTFFESERDALDKHRTEHTAMRDAILDAGLAHRYYRAMGDADPVNFIHLDEANIVYPEGDVPVGLWRGRIGQITGWAVGRAVRAGG